MRVKQFVLRLLKKTPEPLKLAVDDPSRAVEICSWNTGRDSSSPLAGVLHFFVRRVVLSLAASISRVRVVREVACREGSGWTGACLMTMLNICITCSRFGDVFIVVSSPRRPGEEVNDYYGPLLVLPRFAA